MKNLVIIFIIILISINASGDEYIGASTKQYKSQNGLYTLTIFPTYTPKNYYKKIEKRNKNHDNRPIKDTIIPCHAILTKRISKRFEFLSETIWKKTLVNETAPQEAFVTNVHTTMKVTT